MAKKPARKIAKKSAPARAKKAAPKKALKASAPKKMAAKKAAPRKSAKAAAPKRVAAAPAEHSQQHVIPQLVFKDASKAIEFYKQAFGASELMRMASPDGKAVWHAELKVGDHIFFVNDESPMSPIRAVTPENKPTASVNLYLPDVDATFNKALAAGATVSMPLADMFWGDRFGVLVDPFGCVWGLATKVKEMTMEEMNKAGEEAAKAMAAQQGQAHDGQPPAGESHPEEHGHDEHPSATQPPAEA